MKARKKSLWSMICMLLTGGVSVLLFSSVAFADNPIVQTNYVADPAPMVYNDTVYLYTTHDEDVTRNASFGPFFTMDDWKCYSSTDMVNWTDHGTVLSKDDFTWANKDAWAAQCIERNGKFYFYITIDHRVGVAVADGPTEKFHDPIGKQLVSSNTGIDPTVFIDDADEQAYMYWGNPDVRYVALNEDMTSFKDPPGQVPIDMIVESFGQRSKIDPERPNQVTTYEEGPWTYKRNGIYYMVFAAGPISEHIGYSTSTGPTGPWEYSGVVMPTQGRSFTNHPGVIDYKGHSYFFYHNGALPGGGGYKRSVCIEEFEYGEDGSIPTIQNMTKEGVTKAADTLNPYTRTEAETIAWTANINWPDGDYHDSDNSAYHESRIKTEPNSRGGMNIRNVRNGNYIKVREVDFRNGGASSFMASVACGNDSQGGKIQVYLDSHDPNNGKLIGEMDISSTDGWDNWKEVSTNISDAKGIHDVYFVFSGDEASTSLFKMDYWKFTPYVDNIRLSSSTLALNIGEERKLSATILPEEANNSIRWTSTNNGVATVIEDGTVKAVAKGTTTITAEAQDGSGIKGTCVITVKGNTDSTSYKITYMLNKGTNNSANPTTYSAGTSVTLQNPVRAGYLFGGWYSDSGFKTRVTTIANQNATVYAKWNKVSVGKASVSVTNKKSRQASVKIKRVTGANGYELQYAQNSKFSRGKKTVPITKTSRNITKLKKGTIYFFRARAFRTDSAGKKVFGKYGKTVKLKIKR